MPSTVGSTCKISAVILFILDFIGSIVLGNTFGYREFNFAVFFYGVIAGFILCLLIYALGEIIDQLEASNNNTYEIYHLLAQTKTEDAPQTGSMLLSSAQTNKSHSFSSNEGWVCKKCTTLNDKNALFCKGCGEYK